MLFSARNFLAVSQCGQVFVENKMTSFTDLTLPFFPLIVFCKLYHTTYCKIKLTNQRIYSNSFYRPVTYKGISRSISPDITHQRKPRWPTPIYCADKGSFNLRHFRLSFRLHSAKSFIFSCRKKRDTHHHFFLLNIPSIDAATPIIMTHKSGYIQGQSYSGILLIFIP